ncbi:MAG: polyphosphate kinase 1, partial [Actinomycetes bacterium]
MRGTDNQSRADEYHGREAVKRSTEAAYEEFSTDPAPAAEKADADLRDPSLYVNRELSMLDFFERVVDEARDVNNPLLERVKFVGILGSILGEFFMVRIAGLHQQVDAGVTEASADGYTPQKLLPLVQERAWDLMKEARACFSELRPELDAAGIHMVDYATLDAGQKAALDAYYVKQVFPVLTPLAFDPGRPFPHISNMSHNLAVLIRDQSDEKRFARVKVPGSLPRLVPVPAPAAATSETAAATSETAAGPGAAPQQWFTWLEQVIAANLQSLFPGMEVLESHAFRVTRDAELAIQELEADDLLETIERFVRRRRFGSVIRVTIDEQMPERIRGILSENLELDEQDIYTVKSPLGLSSLWDLQRIDRPDLSYQPLVQSTPTVLEDAEDSDIFAAIRQRDILLHHPYDSFDPVVDFVSAAAADPDVLAIKTTLYRVGRNAPVVDALMEAAANGKQVAVLLELKARFDEESNIGWAKALEREGVHVVYGLVGLKTHSKIMLVVRREGDRIRRYVHLGTGNYNSVTTKQYTDLGYLTCDEDLGADASVVFNQLTGYATSGDYRKFLVAPTTMRRGVEERIEREIAHAERGEEAHLIFKMNSLVDKPMIRLLYRASQAGVKVELNVRGMCCLRPGVPGVSDNITERSIVGRFLEHSRIYWFR